MATDFLMNKKEAPHMAARKNIKNQSKAEGWRVDMEEGKVSK